MTHRRTLTLIEAKDREFHRHIVNNRVDPTAQSANNPVPDYYGITTIIPSETHSDPLLTYQERKLAHCINTAKYVLRHFPPAWPLI